MCERERRGALWSVRSPEIRGAELIYSKVTHTEAITQSTEGFI